MSEKRLTFAVFSKYRDSRTDEIVRKLSSLLSEHEMITADSPRLPEADYAISIGGDGTFLDAASKIGALEIPIIGINHGRLGFLADILPCDMESAIKAVITGNYRIDNHAVIHVEAKGLKGHPFALNEVAVLKRDTASMISITTKVDDQLLTTYQADGLIISTPTGSTAYNLSNGGPVMVNSADTLCLTAVAPHSLNVRPIVVGADSRIDLSVSSRSRNHLIAIDGRSETLPEGTPIRISRADHTVRIIRTSEHTFFSTLRGKMMWGADVRK